jgi:hypothetical protein
MLENSDARWFVLKSGRRHPVFLYVLPRRERTEGIRVTWTNPDKPNQELIRLERRWDIFSAIGLWFVIFGIVLQGLGVWLSPLETSVLRGRSPQKWQNFGK